MSEVQGAGLVRLIALEPMLERDRDNSIRWLCHCCCGEYTVVGSSRLLTGHTESCSCMREEMRGSTFVHGTCLEFKSSKNQVNATRECAGAVGNGRLAGRYHHLGTYEDIQEAAAIRQDA